MMQRIIEDLELVVPDEKLIRKEIRQKVDEYFANKNINPPATYLQINQLAEKLIEIYNWNEVHLAFVMVCCSNSIWRKVFSTIPFNRRILLLPQCLKNSNLCDADLDEFGLICKSCGNCKIQSFTEEAEKLGYVVLVTEGTSVASKLIESGKIDAVIGVGCMEVLQKMFNTVQKRAVPGIAIPLLENGCKDTRVDKDWILEEIKYIDGKNGVKLVSLSEIKSDVQAIFNQNYLKEIIGSSFGKSVGIAIESILMGGNRHRAFLTWLVYKAFSSDINKEIVSKLALSIECFHKASLIHDDIEDNDFARYGKNTLHVEYGVPVAINIGDLLVGEGYRLIAQAGLSPEIAMECIKIVSEAHKNISIGQGEELLSVSEGRILSVEEMLRVFELKTATAFRISLLLGAIAAKADPASIKILEKFSYNIGIAYQLKDDIVDFKSKNGDIEKRRFSILISLLIDSMKEKDCLNLKFYLNSNDFEQIYKLIDNYKVKDEALDILKFYIYEAKKSLDMLKNSSLKVALYGVLGKMFSDYF
jgi:geranylgeranyl diphosphate synthase, type II